MSVVECPACGSKKLKKLTLTEHAQLTLGDEFSFVRENYVCETCEEQGDFGLANDEIFKAAERNAETMSVEKIIEYLADQKISMARFERAFEIPQRTLNRWKSGDFSSTSLALLRTVATCPWLVNVAEHRFERAFVASEIFQQTVRILEHQTKQNSAGVPGVGFYLWDSVGSKGAVMVANSAQSSVQLVASSNQVFPVAG